MNNDNNSFNWNPHRRPSSTIKRKILLYRQAKGPVTSHGITRYTNKNGSSTYAHRIRHNTTGNIINFTNFVSGPSPKRRRIYIPTTPTNASSPLHPPIKEKQIINKNKKNSTNKYKSLLNLISRARTSLKLSPLIKSPTKNENTAIIKKDTKV